MLLFRCHNWMHQIRQFSNGVKFNLLPCLQLTPLTPCVRRLNPSYCLTNLSLQGAQLARTGEHQPEVFALGRMTVSGRLSSSLDDWSGPKRLSGRLQLPSPRGGRPRNRQLMEPKHRGQTGTSGSNRHVILKVGVGRAQCLIMGRQAKVCRGIL